MVPISDRTPETRRKPEAQQPSGNTPTPAKKENNAGVFRVGLTSTQAQAEGLGDLFQKYNTDKDDQISKKEFNKYVEESGQKSSKKSSGKIGAALRGAVEFVATNTPSSTNRTKVMDTVRKGAAKVLPTKENAPKIKENIKATGEKVFRSMHKGVTQALIDSKRTVKEKGTFNDVNTATERFKQNKKRVKNVATEIPASQRVQRIINKDKDIQLSINDSAEEINQAILNDLDETNENSSINLLTNRFKNKDFKPEEINFFKENGIDIDNLSDEDCANLAKEVILMKYTDALLDPILQAVENNDAESFATAAQILMNTQCNSSDLANIIITMATCAGKEFSEDQIRAMSNTYANTYHHEDGTNEELEEIATTEVMTYADEEYINILYQNNSQIVDKLNKIALNVAENSTDESRRAMLNNIVKNSSEIIKNSPQNANNQNSKNIQSQTIKNNVEPNAPPVSNPIQNAQANYINELKQKSLELQQMENSNNVIPETLTHAFTTVREYKSFTGTGMTLFEYQETKSTLKNNFTSAVNEIIKDYTTMPDVFKSKVLTLFDSLDDNMLGELFINGNQDIHQFMYKYGYMTDSKLLAFAERKPAEFSNASPKIKLMLQEIKEEEVKKI